MISEHPVLLNRAPTLHRLAYRRSSRSSSRKSDTPASAGVPRNNAGFDGDQITVHIPLSPKAVRWTLMLSANNLLARKRAAYRDSDGISFWGYSI